MADLLLRDYQSREKEAFEDYSHINLYEDYLKSNYRKKIGKIYKM